MPQTKKPLKNKTAAELISEYGDVLVTREQAIADGACKHGLSNWEYEYCTEEERKAGITTVRNVLQGERNMCYMNGQAYCDCFMNTRQMRIARAAIRAHRRIKGLTKRKADAKANALA